MKKQNKKQRLLTLVSCLAVILGMAGTAAAHPSVKLKDADGNYITELLNGPAYSINMSCGLNQAAYCHDPGTIEKHSYHAQLGANQQVGFAPFNPNSSNSYLSGVATKGKSWVQSPGHVGKW